MSAVTGRRDCPVCQGSGFVVDRDPLQPARVCACTREREVEGAELDLPARYREASFPAFWKHWRDVEPRRQVEVINRLAELEGLLAAPPEHTGDLPQRDRMERLVHLSRTNVQHGIRPLGAEELAAWATKGKHRFRGGWEFWYLHGAPQTGKTTLAAAALRAWTERTGKLGRFVPVRTLSQRVKNTYNDLRSFQNTDFVSVRDLMDPLKDVPCLVLDDFDCLDGDVRVAAAFSELLAHRYDANLPTLMTAVAAPEALERKEGWPFSRLQDLGLLRRLEGAERVEMVPALAWWLERL